MLFGYILLCSVMPSISTRCCCCCWHQPRSCPPLLFSGHSSAWTQHSARGRPSTLAAANSKTISEALCASRGSARPRAGEDELRDAALQLRCCDHKTFARISLLVRARAQASSLLCLSLPPTSSSRAAAVAQIASSSAAEARLLFIIRLLLLPLVLEGARRGHRNWQQRVRREGRR